jgi:hypothetical protein
MKKYIYSKTFLTELEQRASKSECTPEEFKKGLWFFLCSLKWNELNRLFNQLPKLGWYKENKACKTNIGNVNDLILLNILGNFYETFK